MELHRPDNVFVAGAPLDAARAAIVLIHGRGATAESILSFAGALTRPDVAFLAPQATGNSWYPNWFMAPAETNEPWLSSALSVIGAAVAAIEAAGIPPARLGVMGFSQGACLSADFIARNPRRYGFAALLSGGFIGAPGTAFDFAGSLAGTPVFVGCSDVDPHIPLARVEETAAVLAALGASVDKRIYPGMGHTVNKDEIGAIRPLVDVMASG
jgi:predicted esterase